MSNPVIAYYLVKQPMQLDQLQESANCWSKVLVQPGEYPMELFDYFSGCWVTVKMPGVVTASQYGNEIDRDKGRGTIAYLQISAYVIAHSVLEDKGQYRLAEGVTASYNDETQQTAYLLFQGKKWH